ncbi:MAG TPA: flavodoxin domain-containing protein [Gammaproteobacteria bacterium]
MHILIVYGTKEGQTAAIAGRMSQIIRNQKHQVTTYSVKEIPTTFSTDTFDAAMVGGSIHVGAYPAQLRTFVTRHHDWLNSVPSGFFTVCMAVHSQYPAEREAAKTYGSRFFDATQWHPQLTETFAGAVKYTQYNFITRYIMKMITKREGGSTDTTHDHEYTDWDAVARFTHQFLETITQREKARTTS